MKPDKAMRYMTPLAANTNATAPTAAPTMSVAATIVRHGTAAHGPGSVPLTDIWILYPVRDRLPYLAQG